MNRLRQVLTVFLVGLTFFVMQAFGYGVMPAQADNVVKSAEGVYYKGTPDGAGINNGNNGNNGNDLLDNARKNLKATTDKVGKSSEDVVKSAEGIYYKGTPDGTKIDNGNNGNNVLESAKKNLKETVDNVRGKLSDSSLTPEAISYEATSEKTGNVNNGTNIIEQAKESLKETADNVREKLNLDEPLPRSTKEFLNSTEERVEDTVEPITRTKEGYYQEPAAVR